MDQLISVWLLGYQRRVGKPLIVGAEKYGRIGNRLYLGAHLVAWAKKTGAELLNLGFHDCEDLFEATYKDAICRFPEPNQPILISKGFKRLLNDSVSRISLRHVKKPSSGFQTIELRPSGPSIEGSEFKKHLVKKPVNFIRGFIFDNAQPDIAEEHPFIHHYFRPRKKYVHSIENPIFKLRKKNDVVLGVVIRHGDFKTWRKGEFYFETSEYVRLMDRAIEYLAPVKTGFFIASDEEQPRNYFGKYCHYFRAGHAVENLGSLSLCDGMLAASSSFTGWSQYYGSVPTYQISRKEDPQWLKKTLDRSLKKSRERSATTTASTNSR